jgi:hypothetical protein
MTIFRNLILSVCIAIGIVVAIDSLMWLWDLGANGKLVAPWLSAVRHACMVLPAVGIDG